jgi:hypothetical protein
MKRPSKVTEFSDNGPDVSEHWHVNRGIPIVWLISTSFISIGQLCALFWYAGQFNTRVEVVEKVQAAMAPQGERLTRLEEKVVSVQATANRIEALLTKPNR